MPVSAGELELGVADPAAGLADAVPLVGVVEPVTALPGASDRGTGWLGGGAPPFTTSPETLLSPDAPALGLKAFVACLRTSVALSGFGSTRLGSPTCDASLTSGRLRKFAITRSRWPGSRRLASSALFWAIASFVGVGTGRCSASK